MDTDTGAWNTIQPVLLAALAGSEPVRVAVHFSGACARLMRAGKLTVRDERIVAVLSPSVGPAATEGGDGGGRLAVANLSQFVTYPHHITIIGASASAEGAADGGLALCRSAARSTIALVEDRYATSLRTLDGFKITCPARSQQLERAKCAEASTVCLLMAVADSIAREQVLGHSSYQGALEVTGSPQFDEPIRRRQAVGRVDETTWLQRERTEVRRRLGIGAADFVVLHAGQPVGDDEVLQLLVDGIKAAGLRQSVRVLYRSHPRQSADELESYNAVHAAAPSDWFSTPSSALDGFRSSEELVAGVDVVISGYSSTNYYAMLVGVPGVFYARVPKIVTKFRNDKKLDEVPEVAAGAAWSVGTPQELAHAVRETLLGASASAEVSAMQARQREVCRFHDGAAAGRVWSRLREATADRLSSSTDSVAFRLAQRQLRVRLPVERG